jgi:hypothetical protein
MAATGAGTRSAFGAPDTLQPVVRFVMLRDVQQLVTIFGDLRLARPQRGDEGGWTPARGAVGMMPLGHVAVAERVRHALAESQTAFLYVGATTTAFRAPGHRDFEGMPCHSR